MKKYRKVIVLLLALATVSDTVPVITNPITVEAASSIKLSKSKLIMGLGDTYTLKLAGAKNPVWKSSNGKIAIVKNGKVVARKTGKVTISATYKGKSYKCIVLVKSPKISSAKFSMTVGTKKQVKVLNTINRVAWFTSNKSIAVVDRNGLVTARKAGKVKITGKLHGKNYTSVITVKKSLAKPVTLSKKSAKVLIGSSLQLKLNNAASSKVVWKTSNKSIATVSKGKVVPKKSGKVTITAVYNKKSYKCTVVIPQPAITSSDGYALAVGKSLTLKTTNTKGKVTWKSSDTSVATINSLGKVTAKKTGKTTISAVVGSCTIKKNIEVVDKGDYTSETINVVPGETIDIAEGTVTDYTKGLVSIDGRTVKMLKPGTARVTVKSKSGMICDYEFKIKKSSITATEMQLGVGFSDVLDLLDNKLPITWSSSNPAIVTVDADGIVVGKKKGTAVITGLAGGVEYTCKVTVLGNSSNGSGNNNKPGTGNNTGNTGSSNGSNSGNNGNGNTGSSTGSNGSTGGSTTNKPGSGNNGSTGSNSGSNGSTTNKPGSGANTGSTTNKPSTVTPDSEAEIKRYDWNDIKSKSKIDLGELLHGNKMQLIIDNAPDVSFSFSDYCSSLISIDKNGVLTTKADPTKKGDEFLNGEAYIWATSGSSRVGFIVDVKALDWTVPVGKKVYEFSYTLGEYQMIHLNSFDVPEEAKRDVFNYFFGNNVNAVKVKYETMYGQKSPYLDFGGYAVKGADATIGGNVYESYDRLEATFGWLKNKPDYVKVREVARWMTSHITYGNYTSDGTFLGIKSGICETSASFFSVIMWYLGVECDKINSEELNHAWNMVKIDGYWYKVDTMSSYEPDINLYDVFTWRADSYNTCPVAEAFIATHPYGTKYMGGYKTIMYNTVEEIEGDLNNKSSKLWQAVNEGSGVAINFPANLNDKFYNTSFREKGLNTVLTGYQNPLSDVANAADESRLTKALALKSQTQPVTVSIPPLSNYLN